MKHDSSHKRWARGLILLLVIGLAALLGTAQPNERCGDGVCDDVEQRNPSLCSEDCAALLDDPDPCLPNPWRAVISEELLEWHNWFDDGGFEEGTARPSWDIGFDPMQEYGGASWTGDSAHSGTRGYRLETASGQLLPFSLAAYVEKGDGVRFSFWVRSREPIELLPHVFGTSRATPDPVEYRSDWEAFDVGTDWTQISFEIHNTSYEKVYLHLPLAENMQIGIDDVAIEQHVWKTAEIDGVSRNVGTIDVPVEPVAPVMFTVLIHIEDPQTVIDREDAFWRETTRMRELARVLHNHGGFLTIQPEEDWVIGSEIWAPGLLAEMAQDLGVVYSTHTHGPHCTDPEGRLRSSAECRSHQDDEGWDFTPNDYEDPWVTEYVRALHDLIEDASGATVSDHNGNWEYDDISSLSQIPMLTWSAYKNRYTQQTYDMLINNPWRPSECNAALDVYRFLTHDPGTPIVYIPGWGQNIARYNERLQTRIAPLLSQFIANADPERVNTCYVVTHVGSFHPADPDDEDTYLVFDETTGEVVHSDQFLTDLAYWDTMLTEVIDPLVEEGYLVWASLPEMGQAYLEWEEGCDCSE